jgi:hypothetical protein
MPCRKMLPVIGLLPKFAEPSVTLLPSEFTLALTETEAFAPTSLQCEACADSATRAA